MIIKVIADVLLADLDIDAIGLRWICFSRPTWTLVLRESLVSNLKVSMFLVLIFSISHYLWTANKMIALKLFEANTAAFTVRIPINVLSSCMPYTDPSGIKHR